MVNPAPIRNPDCSSLDVVQIFADSFEERHSPFPASVRFLLLIGGLVIVLLPDGAARQCKQCNYDTGKVADQMTFHVFSFP